MRNLPSGTVTFLFTDIEGSTKLWESVPEKMQAALQLHHEILRSAIEYHGGVVFQIVGDAFCAAFPEAPLAVAAAVQAQCALFKTDWDLPVPIRVRMGIHTGRAEPVDPGSVTGGYPSNQTLNRASRIMSAGHGGQILLSLAAEELSRDALPEQSSSARSSSFGGLCTTASLGMAVSRLGWTRVQVRMRARGILPLFDPWIYGHQAVSKYWHANASRSGPNKVVDSPVSYQAHY